MKKSILSFMLIATTFSATADTSIDFSNKIREMRMRAESGHFIKADPDYGLRDEMAQQRDSGETLKSIDKMISGPYPTACGPEGMGGEDCKAIAPRDRRAVEPYRADFYSDGPLPPCPAFGTNGKGRDGIDCMNIKSTDDRSDHMTDVVQRLKAILKKSSQAGRSPSELTSKAFICSAKVTYEVKQIH